jgi:ribosome maturation factor RimP
LVVFKDAGPQSGARVFFRLFPVKSLMSALSHSLQDVNRDALRRVVEPVVRAHGAEVVDLELRSEQTGWVLRVTVEKAGAAANHLSTRDAAVDLELCADISRDLSPALDVADLIPHMYHLEVGSPGVERRLRGEDDFVRFAGQKAKLKLREAIGGQRVVIGVLRGVDGGVVRVEPRGGAAIEVPIASIVEARLVFELAARPKGAAGGRGAARPKGAAAGRGAARPSATNPEGNAGDRELKRKH